MSAAGLPVAAEPDGQSPVRTDGLDPQDVAVGEGPAAAGVGVLVVAAAQDEVAGFQHPARVPQG